MPRCDGETGLHRVLAYIWCTWTHLVFICFLIDEEHEGSGSWDLLDDIPCGTSAVSIFFSLCFVHDLI